MKQSQIARQERNAQMVEKIVAATGPLLLQQGYEDLTIREICANAGITTGMFYRHFVSKDDVLKFPVIVKPRRGSASKGILVIDDAEPASRARYMGYMKHEMEKRGFSSHIWGFREAFGFFNPKTHTFDEHILNALSLGEKPLP